jgi:cell division cycle 20-like protein 1 (cofactor of APC complex)
MSNIKMLNFEKNNAIINSPKKTFNILNMLEEDKEKFNKNSYNSPDNKPNPQANNLFSSPLSKRILNMSESDSINRSGSGNDNNNYIYSPYVKRIDISGNKIEIAKDNNSINTYFTSCKKATKKFYTPSPNLVKTEKLSDRFIPLNKGINLMEKFNLTTKFQEVDENKTYNEINREENDNKDMYDEMLKTNFLNEYNTTSFINKLNISKKNTNKDFTSSYNKMKLFSWKKEKNKKNENFFYDIINAQKENDNILNNNNYDFNLAQRKISIKPYKELPAPNLMDDFYLNLLDWSSKNQIAVGCSSSLILWNNNKTQSETLFTYDINEENNDNENNENNNKYVSSLIWSEDGDRLAVGNSFGFVEIYDINKKELITSFKDHLNRVGVVSWNRNLISSGSKDYSIITRDIRCKNNNENIIRRFLGHQQEVCGLKWSFDGSQLASGGNDNNLMVWSLHSNRPLMCNNDHLAAVKAIAWSPHQHNILASGGGTADRTIRFWNTNNFENIFKIDTGSQVCNLVFSKSSNELVSTHGYSLNQINVWKLPNMQKMATLTGHSFRVLYLSLSPDGQSIVTGAGDKTLKFWNIFPPFKNNYNSKLFPSNKDFR